MQAFVSLRDIDPQLRISNNLCVVFHDFGNSESGFDDQFDRGSWGILSAGGGGSGGGGPSNNQPRSEQDSPFNGIDKYLEFRSTIIDQWGKVIKVIPDDDFGIYQLGPGEFWQGDKSKLMLVGMTKEIHQYKVGTILKPSVINYSEYSVYTRSEDGKTINEVKPGQKWYSPIDGIATCYSKDDVFKVVVDENIYGRVSVWGDGSVDYDYLTNNGVYIGVYLDIVHIVRGGGWRNDIFERLRGYAKDSIFYKRK